MMIKNSVSTYRYQAYLKQYLEVVSRTTTRDANGQTSIHTGTELMLLSSQIVSGYVQANDAEGALTLAKADLLARFPEAKGYREHEHVKVKKVEEH